MSFFVCARRRKHERRKARCIIFFPRDGNRELRGESRGPVFGCLKHAVREFLSDSSKIVFRTGKMTVACVLEQKFKLRSMQLETVDLLVA